MFDIGFPELLLIAVIGLLVIGPKRLPEALRTMGLWIGRLRRSFSSVKAEIEKEIGMDEIRRQLHNEAVMEEMKRIERDVRHSVNDPDSSAGHMAPGPPDRVTAARELEQQQTTTGDDSVPPPPAADEAEQAQQQSDPERHG